MAPSCRSIDVLQRQDTFSSLDRVERLSYHLRAHPCTNQQHICAENVMCHMTRETKNRARPRRISTVQWGSAVRRGMGRTSSPRLRELYDEGEQSGPRSVVESWTSWPRWDTHKTKALGLTRLVELIPTDENGAETAVGNVIRAVRKSREKAAPLQKALPPWTCRDEGSEHANQPETSLSDAWTALKTWWS